MGANNYLSINPSTYIILVANQFSMYVCTIEYHAAGEGRNDWQNNSEKKESQADLYQGDNKTRSDFQ